jgi:hypothetical protein
MPSIRWMVALLTAGAVLAVPVAARAENACDAQTISKPKHKKGTQAPPLFIGDSTGIFAAPRLAKRGVEANARGCRQIAAGLDILRSRKAHGALPRVVIIHLGANGSVTQSDIRAALRITGRHRILVLVTNRETGGGSGSDAQNERIMARQHPQRIRLLDWVKHARGHPNWFAGDGLHVTFTGADALASFIAGPARRFNAPWGTRSPAR